MTSSVRPTDPPDGTKSGGTRRLADFALRGGLGGSTALAFLAAAEIRAFGGRSVLGVAMGITAGAVVGIGIGLAQGVVGYLRPAGRRTLWLGLGLAWGLLAAASVSAFSKIGGPYSRLAWLTIGAGASAGLAVGALLAIVEPAEKRLRYPWLRVLLATLPLALGAVATWIAGRVSLFVVYSGALHAVVLTAWLVTFSGSLVAWTWALERARIRRLAVVSAAVFVAAAVRVGTARDREVGPLLGLPSTQAMISLLRAVTDVDMDGFSSLLAGGDCAPFDPTVSPSAREVQGNGIDENCRFGDAKPPPPEAGHPPPLPDAPSPVNVVMVLFDSLRPDYTTPYGAMGDPTPNLNRLAREGLRFSRAYTAGAITDLAIHSMMLGLNVRKIHWRRESLPNMKVTVPTALPRPGLAHWLRRRGMRTLAVVNRTAPLGVSVPTPLAEEFDVVDVPQGDGNISNAALRLMEENRAKPFFLWVHYFRPHRPGEDPSTFPLRGRVADARYDKDVRIIDGQFGRLLGAIDAIVERPTVVLAEGDHGEVLSSFIPYHGGDLLEDSIRIPLILRAPGVSAGVVENPVSLIDVFPTILGLTNTPAPHSDGEDLLHSRPDRVVLTDLLVPQCNMVAATTSTHRWTLDFSLHFAFWTAAGDYSRPPRPSFDPMPASIEQLVGAYTETYPDEPPRSAGE